MMQTYSAQPIQAFPLIEGKVNLLAGTHDVKHLIHCSASGNITITFPSGTAVLIAMTAGQDYGFTGSVTIPVGGTFHVY